MARAISRTVALDRLRQLVKRYRRLNGKQYVALLSISHIEDSEAWYWFGIQNALGLEDKHLKQICEEVLHGR